jgi:hypothetical protein
MRQQHLCRQVSDCPQPQSPLFDLPQELRDLIYEFYAYEEDGYRYEYPARKLRPASGRALNLLYSCKTAAAELSSVLRRAPKITFSPVYSDPRHCRDMGYRGLRSRAGRFECLLHYARWTKLLMLRHSASCVTPDILDEVMRRHPGAGDGIFRSVFHPIQGNSLSLASSIYSRHHFASLCDAVQCALELASTHPDFESFIAKACGPPQSMRIQGDLGRAPFVQGSHWRVLSWKPVLWSMPSDAELTSMERLLTDPGTPAAFNAEYPEALRAYHDCALEYRRVKWYFSATTVAIDFLERLPREDRMRLRCLVLEEKCRSVANPECHAEGLIPFCRENKDLRITMTASIWTNMAPSIWVDYWGRHMEDEDGELSIEFYLYTIVDWLHRTSNLTSIGMPPNAFSMLLEGSLPETLQIWDHLKQLAALKDVAALVRKRRKGEQIFTTVPRLRGLYSRGWNLPSSYPSAIRAIVRGESVIHFDGEAGELWDRDSMADARMHWSEGDWCIKDSRSLDAYRPPGGAQTYYDLYRRDVEDPRPRLIRLIEVARGYRH